MSFHEKSLWLLFVSLLAVFSAYFATVLPSAPSHVLPAHVGLLAVLIILLIVVQILGSILLAISAKISGTLNGRYDTDERDRMIGLKGARNGSYVLATGVCLSLWCALVCDGNFAYTHLLLACWVIAQLVEIGSRLFLYRRGV